MNSASETSPVSPTSTDAFASVGALAGRAAQAAADLIFEALPSQRNIETKSSATDFVTEMDRAGEQLIGMLIERDRPDDAIIGEEGARKTGTSGYTWFIDPIDGTTNYVRRHPIFSVSVGVELNGSVVAGAVAIPSLMELFTATLGGGAFCNGNPIFVSEQMDLANSVVATGFSYSSERRRQQALRLVDLLPKVSDIRRDGSAAVELCFVACGRLDGFYEDGLQRWDVAAGSLIVEEAGGSFSEIALDGTTFCASGPAIHGLLVELLRSTSLSRFA